MAKQAVGGFCMFLLASIFSVVALGGCSVPGPYGLAACRYTTPNSQPCYIADGNMVKVGLLDQNHFRTMAPELYEKWRTADFDPQEILKWSQVLDKSNNSLFLPEPTRAIAWRQAGVKSAQEASDWMKYGFTPSQVSDLKGEGVTVSNAKEWHDQGFDIIQIKSWVTNDIKDPDEAKLWIENGFKDPEVVKDWWGLFGSQHCEDDYVNQQWGESCPDIAKRYVTMGIGIPELKSLRADGIDIDNATDVADFEALRKHGYSLKKARFYAANGVSPRNVAAFNYNRHVFYDICHGYLHNQYELGLVSPYVTKGKCYDLFAYSIIQWLGPSTALIARTDVGGEALLNFGHVTPGLGDLYVMGQGAFAFTDTTGAPMRVPQLRVLERVRTNWGD